jgi:exodeoxyribonuclease VII large subunit
MSAIVERRRTRLTGLWQLAESYSHHGVLARGFALVRDADGKPLRSAAAVADGAGLEIEFQDGRVRAVAGDAAPRPRPARGRGEPPPGGGQGSLFG